MFNTSTSLRLQGALQTLVLPGHILLVRDCRGHLLWEEASLELTARLPFSYPCEFVSPYPAVFHTGECTK